MNPLTQAKNKTLSASASSLPSVAGGVEMFLQPVRIGIVQTQLVYGRSTDVTIYKYTQACRQPMAENLAVRKEGDRSWRWHTIYMTPEMDLQTNDVIELQGVRFRIMEKTDWKEYGYTSYNAIEDYKKAQ